ncbi:MAG: AEC family transporter [Clostridia bacterium]
MEVFFTVGSQVLIMLILVSVGFFLYKFGKLKDSTIGDLTWLLLNVIIPCLIFSSFASVESGTISPISLIMAVVCAFLSIFSAIVVSKFLFKKEPIERQKVLRFSVIFSNAAFMGLPLVTSVLSDSAIIFASFYIAVFNFLTFTYGYNLMSSDKNVNKLKVLVNPGTIGIALGLPIYLLNINLPEIILAPIQSLEGLNTPIAMIIIGTYIAKMKLNDFVNDKAVYVACLYRLILVPILILGIFMLINPGDELLLSTLIQGSAPTAATTALFAISYNGDAKLASKTVAISTILSLITLPLIMVLATFLINL